LSRSDEACAMMGARRQPGPLALRAGPAFEAAFEALGF